MTPSRELIARLRAVLATLYPDEASSRVIAFDAGLETARIAFRAAAVTNWQAILDEAERAGRLAALLARARSDYPDYEPLAAVERDILAQGAAGGQGGVPAALAEVKVNSAVLRDLLNAAYTDETLKTRVLYDHFRPVYDDLSDAAGKGQKIQRLVEYCEQHGETGKLLDLIKTHNPFQYKRFAARLFD